MNSKTLAPLNTTFANEVIAGLSAGSKYLSSKWFYDEIGDDLFNKITALDEYYLTRTEKEIISKYAQAIANYALEAGKPIEIIELGGGDGSKAIQLLAGFQGHLEKVSYKPLDISKNALDFLQSNVHDAYPTLVIEPLEADFFSANWLQPATEPVTRLLLFLGSTVGNFEEGVWQGLIAHLTKDLQAGDFFLAGFDMLKEPSVIEAAYNDGQGVTKAFNLNLLNRINRELGANFNVESFYHHSFFNAGKQRAESYLISSQAQTVHFEALNFEVYFYPWEAIHTEISRKFALHEIEVLAKANNCAILNQFSDAKNWFIDSLWVKK